jgi:hypothetical protein
MGPFFLSGSTQPQWLTTSDETEIHNTGPEPAEFAPANGGAPQVIPARGCLVVTETPGGWLRGNNALITVTGPGGN